MNAARFTRDGSDALETRIADTCAEIGSEITRIVATDRLQALLLGGGYGRGEGGVFATADGDAPYNDLEFFLCIQGHPRLNERRYGAAIHALEQRMTASLGIDVEFKILSLEKLIHSPTTMFYYDLVCGHRVIAGPAAVLDTCAAHRDASRIPAHEATRLLLNRCSGLLFAAERLKREPFGAQDLDFTSRNIAKAQLAMGDAILASRGLYHWSCTERHHRLATLDDNSLPMAQLIAFHRDGVAFKLRPSHHTQSREELQALHSTVTATAWTVWRQLESKRLGITLSSPEDYANGTDKCPETPALRNALVRLRAFGPKGLLSASAFRYPREGLLNALPLLLWAPSLVPARTAWLSQQLATPVTDHAQAVRAYERLWHQFN